MMAKPWNQFRRDIVRLYINEGRTLKDVRGIMKTQYGFEASIRSYRQHFDKWHIGKYNCKKRTQRRRSRALNGFPHHSSPETLSLAIPPMMASIKVEDESSSLSSSSPSLSRSSQDTQATSPMPEMPPAQHYDAFYGNGSLSSFFYGLSPGSLDQDMLQVFRGCHSGPFGRLDTVNQLDVGLRHHAFFRNPDWHAARSASIASEHIAPEYWHGHEGHSGPLPSMNTAAYDGKRRWQDICFDDQLPRAMLSNVKSLP